MKRSILITIDDEAFDFLDTIRYEHKTPKSTFINKLLLEVQKHPETMQKIINDINKK